MARPSTADYVLRAGDTRPVLSATFQNSAGVAQSIPSTATITFKMRKWGSTALTADTSTATTITSATGGTVSFTPTTTHTGSTGSYWAWFVQETSTGVKSYPNSTPPLHVEITPEKG